MRACVERDRERARERERAGENGVHRDGDISSSCHFVECDECERRYPCSLLGHMLVYVYVYVW